MPRPVKLAIDLHLLRERASTSRTETWSRPEIEHLFSVGRATAQTLTKTIVQVQTIGSTHFVDRPALLNFLDAMIASPSVEEGLRGRLVEVSQSQPSSRPAQCDASGSPLQHRSLCRSA